MRITITVLFLLLTAWFGLGSGAGSVDRPERPVVAPEDIDRAAGRKIMGDPPQSIVGGQTMSCDSCHGIFDSGLEESEVRNQHLEIKLEHGLNARCYNCHSRENRNHLILPGDVEIGFSEVQRLCASCHGPTFRDWSAGIHGKSRGSWEMDSPERSLMLCTECHDPHHPAMRPMAPLPGPTSAHPTVPDPLQTPHYDERNPLRRRHPSTGSAQGNH
jgi:hypothetical protein